MSNIEISDYLQRLGERKKEIGSRIRKERTILNLNQEMFAKIIYVSKRQTIANWEKGRTLPALENFFIMSDVFNCDIAYLFCEQECKRRETTDIHEKTGLSEEAIHVLESKKLMDRFYIETVNKLLTFSDKKDVLTMDIIKSYLFHSVEGEVDIGLSMSITKDGLASAIGLQVLQDLGYLRDITQEEIKNGKYSGTEK